MKLSKMQIIVVDDKGKFDSNNLHAEQEVLYNPTTMSYSKSIYWSDANTRGGDIKKKQYDQVGEHRLQVDLLFDFTMLPKHTFEYWFVYFQALSSETIKENSEQSKRPPVLSINWGGSPYIHFSSCVITQIDWGYELFDYEGNVLRAMAKVTFQEIFLDAKKECAPTVKKVEAKEVETTKKQTEKKDDKKKDTSEKETKLAKKKIGSALNDTLSGINDALTSTLEAIMSAVDGIAEIIEAFQNKILELIEAFKNMILDIIESLKNAAKDVIDKAVEAANETIDNTVDSANDTIDNASSKVNDTIDNASGQVNDTIDNASGQVNDTIDNASEQVNDTIDNASEQVNDIKDTF